jgi:glyoxylase-like metal-dependent hydrolase (beta-lactamase superfamily II)
MKSMLNVKIFTFNAFQENTYVVYDTKSKEAVIFDPGNSNPNEDRKLSDFIQQESLTPTRLINTHCHIDHILGNKFVADTYELKLEAHQGEVVTLHMGDQVSRMYGIPYTTSPAITNFLTIDDTIAVGDTHFTILYTPGHSPASLCFYNDRDKFLIGGDVLFQNSIGRTDLPGGDYNTLIESITTQLLPLADSVTVYPGHGPSTTIGYERRNNPFLNE